MAVTTGLTTLLGAIECIDLDASQLDDLTALAAVPTPEATDILVREDTHR